jgi:tRNA pseudouridine(38-40) synthase
MGKWKGKANSNYKGRKGSRGKDEGGRNLESRTDEQGDGGSFPIEEVKACSEWAQRVELTGIPRRKWAVCFGYIGSEYQGSQINPNANSVERHLEKAFLLAGNLAESNFGNLNKILWSRAARTDKGVHANAQCIACKLAVPKGDEGSAEERALAREEFVNKVNSVLPSDMRVHHITKVTKAFNAKNMCGSRTYHYLLPAYACMKSDALNKLYLDSNSDIATLHATEAIRRYTVDDTTKAELQAALSCYEGTHKFHNFTSGKTAADSEAQRYIMRFKVVEKIVDAATGVQWLLLEIHGQSFLYNQIRKLVGGALNVVRGVLSGGVMDLQTHYLDTQEQRGDIPIAPGIGLYLHEMEYGGYNKKVSSLNNGRSSTSGGDGDGDGDGGGGGGGGDEPMTKKQNFDSEEQGESGSNVHNSNGGDKGAEEGGQRETLDLSCRTAGMRAFQTSIWRHVMEEEAADSVFLRYFLL